MISKRKLLSIHRWTGIVAALFLALQGLSGMAIVFRDELMLLAAPDAPTRAPASGEAALDTMILAVRASHPDAQILRVDLSGQAGVPVMVRVKDGGERLMAFAPADGALLDDSPARSYMSELLYELHARLLAGENGRWAIALNGLALLALAATGPWFWWPGRDKVKRALTLKWRGPPQRLVAELHRVCGVFLCLLLGATAITGTVLVLFAEATQGMAAIAAIAPAPKLPKDEGPGERVPLARTVAVARDAVPRQRIKSVRFKTPDLRVARVILEARGGQNWSIDELWIDRANGRVIASRRASTDPAGSAVLSWVLPLHAGYGFGLAGRLASLCLGLALALFAASGIWLWARRTLRRVAGVGAGC